MDGMVPLDEAARRLGVTHRRVQALVSSGQLPAERAGFQWLVPVTGLRRYQHTSVRRPGRPLTQAGAWTELADSPILQSRSASERDALRRRFRPRAQHRDFYVHPGALDMLRSDPGVVLSGRDAAAEAGAPVDASEIDAYIRERDSDALIGRVRARAAFDEANVHLHVVADDDWPFEPGKRFAPPLIAWLDLEDREDRAAVTLLDRLTGGRIRA